jgi:hypothetical protein
MALSLAGVNPGTKSQKGSSGDGIIVRLFRPLFKKSA